MNYLATGLLNQPKGGGNHFEKDVTTSPGGAPSLGTPKGQALLRPGRR
jgi:hypothetical protein